MVKYILNIQLLFILGALLLLKPAKAEELQNPVKAEIISKIRKANDYWQNANTPQVRSFWDNAAYHTGNMEAYFITGKEKYLDYSILWAEHNNWQGATSNDTANWKYNYGESSQYVLFGDWQICFQTYIDIYNIKHEEQMVERAKGVMEYQMSTPNSDYWWWADGLYMVMPVMTKLYKLTGNELYLDKLYEYFKFAKGVMWDEEEGLFYRDGSYVYPGHTTLAGGKDFWARGDGWVFAGLAKVLQDLPEDSEYRNEFLSIYESMAEALAACQFEEGYWTRSLLDEAQCPGYETSGTAFFTYGFFWGINNGILDSASYIPVALKGYEYLTNIALQPDGRVGYVQPIGSAAIPGQILYPTSTSNFGVGAFLLALSEASRWAKGEMPLIPESITLVDENNLRVTFTEELDETTATVPANYFIESITIQSVTLEEDKKSVQINCSELPFGAHILRLYNIESISGSKIAESDSLSFTRVSKLEVTASAYQEGNPPENTLDYNFGTRWSAESSRIWGSPTQYEEQWIQFDLHDIETVESVDIAFYSGDQRTNTFKISLSEDGETFTEVFDGVSSGSTSRLENFDFDDTIARYVKLSCYGNSQSGWNSITEVRINTKSTATSVPSINKAKSFDNLLLWPNPYSGEELSVLSKLTGADASIAIADISGKIRYTQSVKLPGEKSIAFKIQPLDLSPGIYTVVVYNNSGLKSSTLLVNN
ncbi:glycoside hydrolase family 88 protein [Maribellus mangrovi]|uniref:glycoside hydrolase family 88 protein n=1 Tax=Maribellus mangrovi TaxID=3133146 RepID=UPI0030EF6DC3